MQREEAIEVDRAVGLTALRRSERDGLAGGGVRRVAVGHDHAEPVDGAPLEDGDEDLASGRRRRSGPDEKPRRPAERHESACSTPEEGPSVHRVAYRR